MVFTAKKSARSLLWMMLSWVLVIALVFFFLVKDVSAAKFQVVEDGEVSMYFIGQSADYEDIVYTMFSYTGMSTDSLNNHSTPFGQSISLGVHDAGSWAIFSDLVVDTGDAWFSHASMNSDGLNHIFHSPFMLPDGTNAMMIGFEDIKLGGDKDFNDVMFVVTNLQAIPAVPEPETYMMLLVGLMLVLVFSRGRGTRWLDMKF